MGSVILPQPRLPQGCVIRMLDWGADLTPVMGGVTQRLNRIGSRWQLVITYPRLKPEPDGRILMAAIRRAKTLGAIFPVPQPGLVIGNPGAPVINGANQAGSFINLRGFVPGYGVRSGQFFSIIVGGQRYLYQADQDWLASDQGTLVMPITPMLRLSPDDGAVVEFAQPYIEGTLSGNVAEVELAIARAQPAALTITERA
jgi:hypothetical protein